MKKRKFILLILLSFSVGANVLDVSDAALLLKMVDQIKILEKQYEQMKEHFEAITKQHYLGNIFNDPKYKNYIPEDFKETYKEILTKGYEGLTQQAKALYEKNKIFDFCEIIKEKDEKKSCESRVAKIYQDQAYVMEAFEKAKNRIHQIEALMKKVDEAKDPKAIAELQVRMMAEQVMVSNEQTKLELLKRSLEGEDKMMNDRVQQAYSRESRKTGLIDFDVIDFDGDSR